MTDLELIATRVEGVATNVDFLRALLAHPEVVDGRWHTGLVEEHAAVLAATAARLAGSTDGRTSAGRAGAVIDSSDPLAVLLHGKAEVAKIIKNSAHRFCM